MSFTQPIKRIHFQHTHALRNLWTTLPVLLREIITIIFIYMYVHTYIHQMNESKIVLSIYVSKKDLPFIKEIAGFKELLLCVVLWLLFVSPPTWGNHPRVCEMLFLSEGPLSHWTSSLLPLAPGYSCHRGVLLTWLLYCQS